jgi:hypothetical protein
MVAQRLMRARGGIYEHTYARTHVRGAAAVDHGESNLDCVCLLVESACKDHEAETPDAIDGMGIDYEVVRGSYTWNFDGVDEEAHWDLMSAHRAWPCELLGPCTSIASCSSPATAPTRKRGR